MVKDVTGKEIKIGSPVVYAHGFFLYTGTIIKIIPKRSEQLSDVVIVLPDHSIFPKVFRSKDVSIV